ncbi:MAG: ATP-binding protein [Bacteroidales bacterium]
MDILSKVKTWLALTNSRLPVANKEPFYRETGAENLTRLRMLCLVWLSLSVLFFLSPEIFAGETQTLPISLMMLNILFGIMAALVFTGSQILLSKVNILPVWLIRLPGTIFSISLLWWGSMAGNLLAFNLDPALFFIVCLFIIYGVLILSFAESIAILLNGLLSFFWFRYFVSGFPSLTAEGIIWSFFVVLAFFVCRVAFYRRLSIFLNWDSISSMNLKLKWEIKKHKETLNELEIVKKDLDRQVIEKTKFLRETNERLQEEIAERRYADKVRSVLYRISGFVNQNDNLAEIIGNIHDQLRQVIDVTNFMVGTYDSGTQEIDPVYQENTMESFQRYFLGHTLSSYMIRNRRSLLLDKASTRDLVAAGKVEMAGIPAESWMGVPLMVDERVLGVIIIQSYKSTVLYDQADLQLLEYVSEHLAFAIDRHEVQSRLIKAKEQAEASDRLKSAFLSNLSHEIRTPMNAIVGFTEMIAEPDITEIQRQEYTSLVLHNGYRLLNTISNMIELAKLQVRQMPFVFEELEVGHLLSVLTTEIGPIASLFKKTRLETRLACDPDTGKCIFLADPNRFRQLMFCLSENAVKFTETGFIEIGCQPFEQRQLLFWVRDSGIGINPADMDDIFEWFNKGRKTSATLYQGTGLGLTISKLIVETMNGRIWVESELGKGSCFYFTLPLVNRSSLRLVPAVPNQNDFEGFEQSVHAC